MSKARPIGVTLADGEVAGWEYPGPPGAPTMIFCHATGMMAALYLPLLAPLAGRCRILAFDARGHGATRLAADPTRVPADWRPYQADLGAIIEALGLGRGLLLAGHSFGATMAFEAAVADPGLASAVLLFDPPFVQFEAAEAYRTVRDAGGEPANFLADRVVGRTARFPSRSVARAAWAGRGVFADWPDDALDAYCAHGLRDSGEGDVVLACLPAWEAASFRGVSTSFEASLRASGRLPFALLAAETGTPLTASDEAAIRQIRPDAAVRRLAGAGHFFPLVEAARVQPWLEALVTGALAAGDFPDR